MSMVMPCGLAWAAAVTAEQAKAEQQRYARQVAKDLELRRCAKCGRYEQTPTHNTCDGCGAPK